MLRSLVGSEMCIRDRHHSVLSFDLTADHMRDFAEMMDIEFVHINKDTDINELKRDLFLADLAWKLK